MHINIHKDFKDSYVPNINLKLIWTTIIFPTRQLSIKKAIWNPRNYLKVKQTQNVSFFAAHVHGDIVNI